MTNNDDDEMQQRIDEMQQRIDKMQQEINTMKYDLLVMKAVKKGLVPFKPTYNLDEQIEIYTLE